MKKMVTVFCTALLKGVFEAELFSGWEGQQEMHCQKPCVQTQRAWGPRISWSFLSAVTLPKFTPP